MDQRQLQSRNIEKYDLKLKSRPKDGVILQLHHTVRDSNGKNRRIRFSSGTFDDLHEKLACADNLGNIFILDFTDLKFWKLSSVGTCTALYFLPNKEDILIVANAKKYDISFLDIDNGETNLTLTGHTAPVKHISYSNSKYNNLLTASSVEAILWELRNYTKYFTLNTYLDAQIQQIMFTPAGDYLVACFQNDTVQIWKNETMKSVKQIIPSELKHLKNIAFTMNGRAMAMAGLTPMLILFSMDTWKALKSINLTKHNISGAQQIAFIPQIFDGGANKILAILSSDCTLHLLDLEILNVIHSICPDSSCIKRFVISPTGKYFLCILQLGEVNIYNSSYVMDLAQNISDLKKEKLCTSMQKLARQDVSSSKAEVEQKMRICMDSVRLRRILMQYGEYPDKFRSIIWRSLLNTPRNRNAYSSLIDKGIHPAYKDIEKQFTIHSSVTLKSLKRLLSCLAHWCPLFGVMKFLPAFVFPFVKVLQKDPLLLFECVATILLNYCQLWFEYAPFPPISILAIVENILSEHDQQLLDHFCETGITSQTYALKILETAFSEVLTCSEWLILWDHILSNDPAFVIMAVVSYNIVQRNAIKRLKTHEQLENFFRMQNPIDKKHFLKNAYVLLNDTPDDIHPKRFFNTFISLDKGNCYQQFTGYPKATICMKLAKKNRKMKLQNDGNTLKEMTILNQKIQISERSKKENIHNKEKINSEDETFHKLINKNNMKSIHDIQDNRDLCRKQNIDTVAYPTTIHIQQNKEHSGTKSNKKDKDYICKYSSRSKTKKKSNGKRNANLEKEVEELIKIYKNSDLSDS
ncbi:TBC1 domain family member 31 [Galleria mellonella]|uniref:TBC1 domain family member 31 n=1 Tax=Galleria mellonella TaxID=7137 RepID=A0A6J1WV05_GALME|nr:TBC1 domain family member 31 [Galleria mellonella]XP_052751218.1 TBC1 domain family member 31 [Galleria mellonella]